MQALTAIEAKRRTLRIILFIIILATLPFYCVGIFLWVSAPQGQTVRTLAPSTNTLPPLTRQATNTASIGGPTSLPGFVTSTFSPLFPTPPQFIAPTIIIPPTRIIATLPPLIVTATQPGLIIPTLAPTLTPIPSNTPVLPTNTPIPPIDTPLPPPTLGIFDTDGDGILDNVDVCPLDPAPGTLDGCPPPTAPPTDNFILPTANPLEPSPIPPGP